MKGADPTLVVATSNRGKLGEFRMLLAGVPVELVSIADVLGRDLVVNEDGATFEENAIKKARVAAEQTQMLTLADDSGLEVDALQGGPGVRTARFAGESATDAERIAALLRAMEGVPSVGRYARFCCAICVVDPCADCGESVVACGICGGMIAYEPRGVGGFGYDPVFVVAGGERTMAELSVAEKGEVSHRARAVAALRPKLMAMIRGLSSVAR